MKKKHVFLSYVHEDEEWIKKVEKWADAGRLGDIKFERMKKDWRPEGYKVVEQKLRGMLKTVHAAIVLLGEDAHNHEWIEHEVNVILSAQKAVVVVRIPDTRGAAPVPLGKCSEVRFEPEAIKEALAAALA